MDKIVTARPYRATAATVATQTTFLGETGEKEGATVGTQTLRVPWEAVIEQDAKALEALKAMFGQPPELEDGKHVGQYTVFNAHDELIHMFELAAANMSHRSIRRILKGVPMENYLRPPNKVDYAGSLLRMRTVIHDLMTQAELQLAGPEEAPMAMFAALPEAHRDALLCVSDLWREKLCLDRSFLSAVYSDRVLMLSSMEMEMEEITGSVTLEAREARRQYLLAIQEDASQERRAVAESVDHIAVILEKASVGMEVIRERVGEEMKVRYLDREENYKEAMAVIEEEEDNLLQQLWRSTNESPQASEVRTCLLALERHVQAAYSEMQQRLLRRHLTLLAPLVQFTGVHISQPGAKAPGATK